MNLRQIIIPLLLLAFIRTDNIQAQIEKPMVAYRIGIDWHFYNTKNELMFPVNKVIAPPMVSAYFHGWCKVGLPGVQEGEIVIRNGVINESGIEVPLDGMPDGYHIVAIDIEAGKKIISIGNWVIIGTVNEAGQRVPSTPTFHWQRLGNGWGASYGDLPEDQEKQSEADFPMAGESEMEYEIWDIQAAKLMYKIKAEEIGGYGEGYLTAKKDGLWGIVDKNGKWVVLPKFKNIGACHINNYEDYDDYTPMLRGFEQGVIPAQDEAGKWGLINTKGNWLLTAEYDHVFYVNEANWCFLNAEERWVLTDAKGKLWKGLETEIPGPVFNGMMFHYQAEKGWALVNKAAKIFSESSLKPDYLGQGFYLISKEGEGSTLVDPKGKSIKTYDSAMKLMEIGSFSYGLAPLLVDEQLGFINEKGEWAIDLGKIAFKGGDLPVAMDGFIYDWNGDEHIFYDAKGDLIRKDGKDTDWQMMVILQDGNAGYWAPY
jgi:hypothetical protein